MRQIVTVLAFTFLFGSTRVFSQILLTGQVNSAVRNYLGLSKSQEDALGQIRANFAREHSERITRRSLTSSRLAMEKLRDEPDAAALGHYQVEILTLDREIADAAHAYVSQQ